MYVNCGVGICPCMTEMLVNKLQGTDISGCVLHVPTRPGLATGQNREGQVLLPPLPAHLAARIQFQSLICSWVWPGDPGISCKSQS